MRDLFSIVHEKGQVNALSLMLQRFPQDWKKTEVSMAIFRKASKPMLQEGRASAPTNLADGNVLVFAAKKDKTGTIMRAGLVNKGSGRLGHLFNFGTGERMNYSTGRGTGHMTADGWWDKAVASAKPRVESEITRVAPAIIGRFARKYKKGI